MNSTFPRAVTPANRTPLEQAKLQTDQAETRAEQANTRAEAAETRTEQAEHRIESAKTRTEQAETRTEQAETRTEQAETRTEQAEIRTEQAETRTEQAETRIESAETRTEQAETRTEQAETRAEQAEATRNRQVRQESDRPNEAPISRHPPFPANGSVEPGHPIHRLTSRQREILQFIAQGQNTKQIAGILKISPKTVEYHRLKLMACLNVHDIPGLVRLALRVGFIPPDS